MFYYVIYNSSITNYVENQKKYLTTLLYGSILYILTHAYLSSSNSNFIRAIKPYFWAIILLDVASMYYLYQQGDGQTDWLNNIEQLRNKINNYIKNDIPQNSKDSLEQNVSFNDDMNTIEEYDVNSDSSTKLSRQVRLENINDNTIDNTLNSMDTFIENDNDNRGDEDENMSTETIELNDMLSSLQINDVESLPQINKKSTSLHELRQHGRNKITQKKKKMKSNEMKLNMPESNTIQNIPSSSEIPKPSKEVDDMFKGDGDDSGSEIDFDISDFAASV